MTRVLVPFTDIHPKAENALRGYAPQAERFRMAHCEQKLPCSIHACPITLRHCHHQNCDTFYGQWLRSVWAQGETFVIIEHDIEISAKVLHSFGSCNREWCTFPYGGPGYSNQNPNLIRHSLGCTRFRGSLMKREADVMTEAAAMTQGLPAGDWRRMDVSLLPTLRSRGYEPHVHKPPVIHHHIYPFEGCACGDATCQR